MRIKIINPDAGMSREELEQREKMLMSIARPDTVISMDCLTETNVCIDSLTDVALAGAEIVKRALLAEKEGFDAVGLYCLSDPAINACREMLTIPVLGGGQTAFQVACGLGYRFSLLTTSQQRVAQKSEFVRTTGVDISRLASVRSVELGLENIRANLDVTLAKLVAAGKECKEKDDAQVIILGCLSFAGLGKAVAEQIGIPVVDPAFTLISMIELCCLQGLCHSKSSYPCPKSIPRWWNAGKI
ncbi:MAG: hydrogenase expression protein HupH [Firmicutes bacterium]|nr:hydrogenase expression protein HupH [Bacillota bacterium]